MTKVNKNLLITLFIVILGTFLRLIFIDKPDGLWNDEYISWVISSIPFGPKFFEGIASQCHMPFYYFYLKFFIHFLGNSDLMLRLTSVLPGILSIISMYFVGKEFKDEKLGILCALVSSLSSFLIYFSQEVRFYEILFLFSSLSLLFTLKLLKQQNPLNYIYYILFNFSIIFTHTIGFVFVGFNLIFTMFCLVKSNEKFKKSILIISSLILLSLAFSPFICKICTSHPLSQWWSNFTISKLGFLITDYFSPILTNIVSAPDNFFYNFSFGFVIFAILPSLIAIAGISKALKTRDYNLLGLFYVAIAFIIVLIIMSILGKLVFITKYSIEIYPILILLMSIGLLEFKKTLGTFLIASFCFLNLFYVIFSPVSAPKLHRSEGHKIVANLLKNADLKDGDLILLNYYPKDRFEKYFNFSKYKIVSINKGNFSEYLGVNSKEEFKKIDKKYFDKQFDKNVLKQIKPNSKISIVVLNDVAIYSPVKMYTLFNDEREYKKTPFLFLVFSQLKNDELSYCLKNLQILRIENKGSWSVITFLKR